MKNLFLLAILCLSAQAFGQTCRVNMVDNYNRIVTYFNAYGDDNTCLEGMKQCRKSIRLDYSNNPHYPNGSLDCVRVTNGGYNPPQNPPYNPPQNPNSTLNYYLSMSDSQLAQEAMRGIGSCQVIQGSYGNACQYYMRVNGYGFGGGTGCTQEQYTRNYGCNSYSDFENAGCLVRISLQNRQCL